MSSLTPEVIQQLNAFLRQFEDLRARYPWTDKTALKYAALALANIPGNLVERAVALPCLKAVIFLAITLCGPPPRP